VHDFYYPVLALTIFAIAHSDSVHFGNESFDTAVILKDGPEGMGPYY
jgi:hypothetical protein